MSYIITDVKGCIDVSDKLKKVAKKLKIKGNKLLREMRVKPVQDKYTPHVDNLTRLSHLQIMHLIDK